MEKYKISYVRESYVREKKGDFEREESIIEREESIIETDNIEKRKKNIFDFCKDKLVINLNINLMNISIVDFTVAIISLGVTGLACY